MTLPYKQYGLNFGNKMDILRIFPSSALLKTGQLTQYDGELDDAYYSVVKKIGIAKAYSIRTTGQYANTKNIDLGHYAGGAGAIAFNNVAKTITDTGAGLALFKVNDVILTNAPNNPGPFTVTTGNVAGTITCTGATFVTETPAGAITISKREDHSNNCVLDLNTGLMWSRYSAAKMGITSDGKMPWTGKLYDIFQYAAAANLAILGGYADWRIPNLVELRSLIDSEAPTAAPDSTAFPGWITSVYYFTSTTRLDSTTSVILQSFLTDIPITGLKTLNTVTVCLVRGG